MKNSIRVEKESDQPLTALLMLTVSLKSENTICEHVP
jgi:hypothetical protein